MYLFVEEQALEKWINLFMCGETLCLRLSVYVKGFSAFLFFSEIIVQEFKALFELCDAHVLPGHFGVAVKRLRGFVYCGNI